MNWPDWVLSEFSQGFQWYTVMPVILYHVVIPLILCRFFCRFCGISFRWRYGVGYLFLSAGLSFLAMAAEMAGSLRLILEVLLLALFGMAFLRSPWKEAWITALLLRSVFGMAGSIVKWVDYQILLPFGMGKEAFFLSGDAAREFLKVLFVIGFLAVIRRYFYRSTAGMGREMLLLLTIPLFFIALVEQVIEDSFYGDTLMMDTAGVIWPVVNVSHGENLFLQVLAAVCLFAILLIHKKLARMQLAEKKLLQLSGQAAEQKRYMEEALLREEQTKSFRHDLKNHLTVLKELLQTGKTEEACEYLKQLDEAAKGFSCTVSTGNTAVDALLGSKCAVARQKGIDVHLELTIPGESRLRDIDWCIVLSNAFDNAVNGCEAVPDGERYLSVSGKRKGNLYLLHVENSCGKTMKTPPPEGIGLANIRAVLEPASGTVEKTVSDGVYTLKLLFVLS